MKIFVFIFVNWKAEKADDFCKFIESAQLFKFEFDLKFHILSFTLFALGLKAYIEQSEQNAQVVCNKFGEANTTWL